MARFRLPASIAAFALLLVLTVDPDDAPLVVVLVLLALGLALAMLYDPAVESLVRLRRRPVWHDAALLLLCLPFSLSTVAVVELLMPLHRGLAWAADRPLADTIEWLLAFIDLCLPLVLILAVALAPRQPPGARPPLWPLVATGCACVFAWIGGGFALLAGVRPLIEGASSALTAAVGSPPTLATSALPLGIAVQLWWRALRDRGAARFDDEGMFAGVIACTIAGLAIGLLLVCVLVLPLSPTGMRYKPAVLAAWLTLPIAGAWLWTLCRIRRLDPASRYAPVAAVAVLLVAIPFAHAPVILLADTGDWAELFLLLATPCVVAACAIVVLVVPKLIARLLDPAAPASA